jgi:hypothetical protein
MLRLIARHRWTLTVATLVAALSGCKNGSGGGGY